MNNYDSEAKQRFGETETYKEYEQKTAEYTHDKWRDVNKGLMSVFTKFVECKKNGYTAEFVREAIEICCN